MPYSSSLHLKPRSIVAVDIKDEKIIISLEIDKNSNIEMEKAGFDKKKDLLEKITDRTVELI